MSSVTSVLLHMGHSDHYGRKISELNKFFEGRNGFSLVPDLDGGTKGFEPVLYSGGFNYLDLAGLKLAIAKIRWDAPNWVQLIYMQDDEDRFSLWNLEPVADG